MLTYTRDEIISSTQLGRNIGSILKDLKSKKIGKVAVIRNNEFEAVLLPIDEYEKIAEIYEHLSIADTISKRSSTSLKKAKKFEDILKETGLHENDL